MKSYIRCEKKIKQGVFKEKKRQVTYREYMNMKAITSGNKYFLKKMRCTFMWNKCFYVVDTFKSGETTLSLCTIQGFKKRQKIELPDLIKKNVVKEVSDQVVDIFTELVAKGSLKKNHSSIMISETMLEKLMKFNDK